MLTLKSLGIKPHLIPYNSVELSETEPFFSHFVVTFLRLVLDVLDQSLLDLPFVKPCQGALQVWVVDSKSMFVFAGSLKMDTPGEGLETFR